MITRSNQNPGSEFEKYIVKQAEVYNYTLKMNVAGAILKCIK